MVIVITTMIHTAKGVYKKKKNYADDVGDAEEVETNRALMGPLSTAPQEHVTSSINT